MTPSTLPARWLVVSLTLHVGAGAALVGSVRSHGGAHPRSAEARLAATVASAPAPAPPEEPAPPPPELPELPVAEASEPAREPVPPEEALLPPEVDEAALAPPVALLPAPTLASVERRTRAAKAVPAVPPPEARVPASEPPRPPPPSTPRAVATRPAAAVTSARSLGTNLPPPYPLEAVRRGWHGSVVLRIGVGSDGSVLQLVVLESSGYPLLDQTALDAVARWRFEPARHDGRPVPGVVLQRIRFRPQRET